MIRVKTSFVVVLTAVGAFQVLVPHSAKACLMACLLELARAPILNDVSTDLEDPPSFLLAQHGPLPEHWKPRIQAAYPDIKPFRILIPQAAPSLNAYPQATNPSIPAPEAQMVLDALLATAKAMPRWQVQKIVPDCATAVADSPSVVMLEAVATTRMFKFKDDVIVRVRPEMGACPTAAAAAAAAGTGTGSGAAALRVDVRSKSRVGKHDLATNASRIRMFLTKLREEFSRRGLQWVE